MNAASGDHNFSRLKPTPPLSLGAAAVDPSRIAPLSGDGFRTVQIGAAGATAEREGDIP